MRTVGNLNPKIPWTDDEIRAFFYEDYHRMDALFAWENWQRLPEEKKEPLRMMAGFEIWIKMFE